MLVAPCVSSILPVGAIEVSELKRVIMTWGEDFRWWQRHKFKITKSKDEELPPSHMPLRFSWIEYRLCKKRRSQTAG